MDERLLLYYFAAATGFVMVVGGIWLLYKEKIYLDHESKQPIAVETPLGKFTSNYPALALFALGFIPLIYPIYSINNLAGYVKVEPITIHGLAQGMAESALVFVTVAQDVPSSSGNYVLKLPFAVDKNDYKLLWIVNNRVLDQVHAAREPGKNEINVNFKPVQIEPPAFKSQVGPTPAEFQ